MRFHWFFRVSGILATIAACGSIDDVETKPTLATLKGRIDLGSSSAGPADASALRVAIVWSWPDRNLAGERFTSDVPVAATFPASFSMDLVDPPPAGSMLSKDKAAAAGPSGRYPGFKVDYATWPDGTAVALGNVIAYEDRNHNGKLDLADDDAVSFVDRILGAKEDVNLLYLEGVAPAGLRLPNGSTPQPGYNLRFLPHCPRPIIDAGVIEPVDPSTCGGGYKPLTASFDLVLNATDRLQRFMCRGQLGVDVDHGLPGGEDKKTYLPTPLGLVTYLPAGTPGLTCAPGGRSYEVCRRLAPEGVCRPKIEECTSQSLYVLPGYPAPPNWPCPTN